MAKGSGGRPTQYNKEIHPQLAKWMARNGLIDKEIAAELEITEQTLNNWKKKHKEFFESLKEGKDLVDSRVEDALLSRALGYTYEEDVVAGKTKSGSNEKSVRKVKKHIAPDVTACIFWLKNRQKKNWRDKIDHEHTGEDGGPININLRRIQPKRK